SGARSVLVLVDDATRSTRASEILPHVARELAEAGVDDHAVRILTAQGTHRRMTTEELARKIGPAFLRRWKVHQHDWRDRASVEMDKNGRVQRAAFGDLVAAQRECARAARDLHAARLDEPADVVVTDAQPADRDLWQSVKGLYAGTIAAKEGGVLVLVCPNA